MAPYLHILLFHCISLHWKGFVVAPNDGLNLNLKKCILSTNENNLLIHIGEGGGGVLILLDMTILFRSIV